MSHTNKIYVDEYRNVFIEFGINSTSRKHKLFVSSHLEIKIRNNGLGL